MPGVRLNGIIKALEQSGRALAAFSPPTIQSAIALSTAAYDGIVFECEHTVWDAAVLRDSLQYMLNRRQILAAGSPAPGVTPLVRIPPNGSEMAQWFAKQALDLGAYGIVWPRVSTVEEAYNAVAACRYPRLKSKANYEPAGLRGDGPGNAVRYWGLTQMEYYAKADVWPLDPAGEIFVILMIEDTLGISNLREILTEVPGIGAILIGEGDLSQELGLPRQYDHPEVLSAMAEVVAICKEKNVPAGHPHVGAANLERVIAEGYRFLMCAPVQSFATLDKARTLVGRD